MCLNKHCMMLKWSLGSFQNSNFHPKMQEKQIWGSLLKVVTSYQYLNVINDLYNNYFQFIYELACSQMNRQVLI